MASSKQTVLALKGKDYAILSAKKTCEIYQNIYYGASGDDICCQELELSVKKSEFPRVESVKNAAKFIANHINNDYSQKWAEKKIGVDILLVGNIIHSKKFRIYRIVKSDDAARDYEVIRIKEGAFAIGAGAEITEITEMVGTFRRNFTLKMADLLAFKVISKATVGIGGDIMIISVRKDDAVSSVLVQDDCKNRHSDYTGRTDTRYDPPNIQFVTYRIKYGN